MDPLRSMIMTRDNPDQASYITVEEAIDCRATDSRFFSLLNTMNRLNIILSNSASLISCTLDGQDIVVDPRLYNQTHETWAIGDRPYQKFSSLPWFCHVRGTELLMSTSNGSSSIMFELTPFNELNSRVKLKSIFLQNQVTYLNLNNAREKTPIDGHSLVVQCNGNFNRIKYQATKLLCRCNRRSSVLPKSFIGDIPFQLVRHNIDCSTNDSQDDLGTEDDFILCDSIFYLEATCPLDFLKVQLQFQNRVVLFEVRMSTTTGNPNSTTAGQSASVSSSTTVAAQSRQSSKAQSSDLRMNHAPADFIQPPSMINFASDSNVQLIGHDEQHESDKPNSTISETPSTSSGETTCVKQPDTNNNTSSSIPTKSAVPNTILRARVRITNFGICIMPLMMTSYNCTYRFSW